MPHKYILSMYMICMRMRKRRLYVCMYEAVGDPEKFMVHPTCQNLPNDH